jgi:hypothetical protein
VPATGGSERVTVTLPIHPLRGASLRVLRSWGRPEREQFIEVEHPSGGSLRLPLRWTDRGQPVPVSESARSTARELLRLTRAVRLLLDVGELVGPADQGEGDSTAERIFSVSNANSTGPAAGLVELDSPRAAATDDAGQSVGDGRPSGDARHPSRRRRGRSSCP